MPLSNTPRRKQRSLTFEIVEKFTSAIFNGDLKPGEKLPTETSIMDLYEVSRTVVREAISKLQASGLVETRHGIGTFVLAQPVGPFFRITPDQLATLRDVISFLEFRISIETEAAALAAVRRTDENLSQLRHALDGFKKSIDEGVDAIHFDTEFHQAIALSTHNSNFINLMKSLGNEAIPRMKLPNSLTIESGKLAYLKLVHQEHEAIFNAIEAQDFETARACMRTHLSNSRERHKRADLK